MEYAAILLLLKKRRKPLRTIDQGLRQLFRASNGAAALPLADTTTRETEPGSERTGRLREKTMLVTYANNSAVITEAIPDTNRRDNQRAAPEVGLSERKQAIVDNIDAWAMWVSPPMFLTWNLCYWIAYRLDTM